MTGAYGQDICERTRAFALQLIRHYSDIKRSEVGKVSGRQLLRAGTSIGANVEKAQAAQSKKDFVNKMSIALKEVRETRYWLFHFRDGMLTSSIQIQDLLNEIEQIIRILFAIIKKTKNTIS